MRLCKVASTLFPIQGVARSVRYPHNPQAMTQKLVLAAERGVGCSRCRGHGCSSCDPTHPKYKAAKTLVSRPEACPPAGTPSAGLTESATLAAHPAHPAGATPAGIPLQLAASPAAAETCSPPGSDKDQGCGLRSSRRRKPLQQPPAERGRARPAPCPGLRTLRGFGAAPGRPTSSTRTVALATLYGPKYGTAASKQARQLPDTGATAVTFAGAARIANL